TGLSKTFGFCDFRSADGALKALRNLNGFKVNGEALMLKVDEKTKKFLNDFKLRKYAYLVELKKQKQQQGKTISAPPRMQPDRPPPPATEESLKLQQEREQQEDIDVQSKISHLLHTTQGGKLMEERPTESEAAAVMNTIER